MTTTAWPRAWSMPAETAAWCPKLRLRWSAATCRSRATSASMRQGVCVPAAVIHQEDLVRQVKGLQDRVEPAVQLRQVLLLVEERDHDADQGSRVWGRIQSAHGTTRGWIVAVITSR